jgi:hypothetical protein
LRPVIRRNREWFHHQGRRAPQINIHINKYLHKQKHKRTVCVESSVSDTDLLIPEPDPAFQAEYRSKSGSRVLKTKNLKKIQLKI